MSEKIKIPKSAERAQSGRADIFKFQDGNGNKLFAKTGIDQETEKEIGREAEILELLDGVEGVPQFVGYATLDDERTALVTTEATGTPLPEMVSMEKFKSKMQPPEAVAAVAANLAEVLAECNRRGVLYRDLNPEHLLITDDGRVNIVDWGLAEQMTNGQAETFSSRGTWETMAPEEFSEFSPDTPLTARTNVFTVGTAMHQMLYGDTLNGGTYHTREDAYNGHSRVKLPEWYVTDSGKLEWIMMRAVHPDQEMRFADCDELARAITDLTPEDLRSAS